MSNTESEEHNQEAFGIFLMFTGITPMIFSSFTNLLSIPIGGRTKGAIMLDIYVIGGVVTWWYWGRYRASIGWLFFALAMGVLMLIGVKNNPPAIIAFFGSLLIGFGLILSETLVKAESRTTS